jgi:hypothetical protein
MDDGQGMRHVWGRNMWVELKENDHLEDLGVVGRILEWTLFELVWVGWVAK